MKTVYFGFLLDGNPLLYAVRLWVYFSSCWPTRVLGSSEVLGPTEEEHRPWPVGTQRRPSIRTARQGLPKYSLGFSNGQKRGELVRNSLCKQRDSADSPVCPRDKNSCEVLEEAGGYGQDA